MSPDTLFTLVVMAAVTYLTRIGGYLFLRYRVLSPRTTVVMEAAPGCVLISMIAPEFVSGKVPDLMALAVTVAAATRLSLLPTVVIAVLSAGVLRHCMGG